jgi:hypothetical protein
MDWHKISKMDTSRIIIAGTIVCAVLSIYFRSVYREQPMLDERAYAYICEDVSPEDFWKNEDKCTDKVESIGDAFHSQVSHYKIWNGRFIVHFIEQVFTGVWGIDSFYIVNALAFALMLTLVMLYTTTAENRLNPLLWVLAFSVLILFFPMPWRLWVSYNFAPNYLLPSTLSIVYLYLFDKLIKRRFRGIALVAFCMMSLILGASHEGFSIPLSGAMLLYSCANRKIIFKTQCIYPILCLWIGTMTMLLAPGNYVRLSESHPEGLKTLAVNFFGLVHTKTIWAALIAQIALKIADNKGFKGFLRGNRILLWCLFWSLVVSILVYTGFQGRTNIELFSLLIILRILSKVKWLQNKRIAVVSSTLILIAVTYIEVRVVEYGKLQMINYDKAVSEYVANKDGIVRKAIIDKPFYVEPYTLDWRYENNVWFVSFLSKDYHQHHKRCLPLIDVEYDALANGSMFSAKNAVAGGSGFYGVDGGLGFWAKCISPDFRGKELEFNYKPVDSSNPDATYTQLIKKWLHLESFPTKEKVDSISRIETRWGNYYFIERQSEREVVAITVE